MAEERPPATNITGLVDDISRSIISALPPAFLILVLINVAFLGMVMWFLDTQLNNRSTMIEKFMSQCMEIALSTGKAGVEYPNKR